MLFVNSRFIEQGLLQGRDCVIHTATHSGPVADLGPIITNRMDLGLLWISDPEQPLETVCVLLIKWFRFRLVS